MANTYFQFKQFVVHQELCAMKVCTDSCVFGAIVASQSNENTIQALDIGSGTGLLSLMLAQQLPNTYVDAVELDYNAYSQSVQNFAASSFSKKLIAHHIDIHQYVITSVKTYDLIICNPPFYTQHLKSPKSENNKAKHNDTLTPNNLAEMVAKLLSPDGIFWLLIPISESELYIQNMVQNGLYIYAQYAVMDRETLPAFRKIISFTKQENSNVSAHEICIKNLDNTYTSTFIALLKNYYLHF